MKWGWAIEVGILLLPILWLTAVVYSVYMICVDYGFFLIDLLLRPPLS